MHCITKINSITYLERRGIESLPRALEEKKYSLASMGRLKVHNVSVLYSLQGLRHDDISQ